MYFFERGFQFFATLIFCSDGRPKILDVNVYGVLSDTRTMLPVFYFSIDTI